MTRNRRRRPGAAILESAIVYPLTLLFLLGLVVGGVGMFRYQQVASLAREGARYASVHGGQYAQETGSAAATADDVHQQVVLAKAAGMSASELQSSVTWNTDNWPAHVGPSGTVSGSSVTVTVTYRWVPEAYLGGITLSSTAVLPMSY